MLAWLYKWVYTRVGGRPWTFIIRDEQKSEPLLFMLIFLGLGILVAILCRRYWWQLVLGFGAGILVGHFWW
jgi:hypothetical protein